ncbi:hypothetical protein HNV08_13240 [Winogradskyella eckloniae]|uniref:hypothetical protein n=1 Tax=Winogradskyella eckloniae TaxID=1089306 RepID=UPI0015637ED7|nr:hypothetical protein [Winogradskyella eckloniae]NRD21015.1 hypothetical protein [Winogradskyella eckloniae]
MKIILIIHIVATIFMTGLCWFVQLVHYPLFRAIETDKFPSYERKNAITGIITVPVMIIELITGLILLYNFQDSLHVLNIVVLAFIWLSTFIFQVPIHLKLMYKGSPQLITKVIRTNWIRTLSWTVRTLLLAYLLWTLIIF